jgi:hypothetical protein
MMYDVIRRRRIFCISIFGRNGVEVITGDSIQSFDDNRAAERKALNSFSSMLVPVIRRERVAKPPAAAKPLFLRDRANVMFWKVAILDIVYDDVDVGGLCLSTRKGCVYEEEYYRSITCTSLLIVPDAG